MRYMFASRCTATSVTASGGDIGTDVAFKGADVASNERYVCGAKYA